MGFQGPTSFQGSIPENASVPYFQGSIPEKFPGPAGRLRFSDLHKYIGVIAVGLSPNGPLANVGALLYTQEYYNLAKRTFKKIFCENPNANMVVHTHKVY